MNSDEPFIDYYAVLEADPACDGKTLEAAYRRLAKMYHPDHPDSADVDRFSAVIDAYNALRHEEERARYDEVYAEVIGFATPAASPDPASRIAIDDADAHAVILAHLYKTRRERAQQPGVGEFYLQEMLGCTDDTFAFHRWYLKSKGFIEITEEGTLAITVQGVDHVIATARPGAGEVLRITRSH